MNITILLLVSSALISVSPVFVHNQLSISNSNFNRFSSLLFYKQKSLLIQKSFFKNGIKGIILNKEFTYIDRNFTNTEICENKILSTNSDIVIQNCFFINIKCENSNIIQLEEISLNISDSLFESCSSKSSIISLKGGVKIESSTSIKSESKEDCAFLFCHSRDLFNTQIFETFIDQSSSLNYNIHCNDGHQKFNHINMTNFDKIGFHSTTPRSFSFTYINVNVGSSCFFLSGSVGININIKYVDFSSYDCYSNKSCLTFEKDGYNIAVSNSFLFSANEKLAGDNSGKITLTLENCVIQGKWNESSVELINKSYSYSNKYDVCTTRPFTQSLTFSNSIFFSQSNNFTLSEQFSKSNDFTFSNRFSFSKKFSDSIDFPSSIKFYESINFSNSNDFSLSEKFSLSTKFTNSNKFTSSNAFSETMKFSVSNDFTFSEQFSQSIKFSKSAEFSSSEIFSKSTCFSKSNHFTSSEKFSETIEFSLSFPFSESSHFTSHFFSSSKKFSQSSKFTKSSLFSLSSFFSQSDQFEQTETLQIIDFGNQINKSKNKGKLIGIIVGVIGGVAVIAIVAAVIITKKKNSIHITSDVEMAESSNAVTVDNTLNDVMDQDDPFAEEFK